MKAIIVKNKDAFLQYIKTINELKALYKQNKRRMKVIIFKGNGTSFKTLMQNNIHIYIKKSYRKLFTIYKKIAGDNTLNIHS